MRVFRLPVKRAWCDASKRAFCGVAGLSTEASGEGGWGADLGGCHGRYARSAATQFGRFQHLHPFAVVSIRRLASSRIQYPRHIRGDGLLQPPRLGVQRFISHFLPPFFFGLGGGAGGGDEVLLCNPFRV